MKGILLFGLALLCALPGCCGMWKCKKPCDTYEENGSSRKGKKEKEMVREDKKYMKDMKDKTYKK